jgi:hypothetical protein
MFKQACVSCVSEVANAKWYQKMGLIFKSINTYQELYQIIYSREVQVISILIAKSEATTISELQLYNQGYPVNLDSHCLNGFTMVLSIR